MSSALDGKLTQLQNLVKRDPISYRDEFEQQHRHYLSELEIFRLTPSKKADHFGALISFLAHTAQAHKAILDHFPDQLCEILYPGKSEEIQVSDFREQLLHLFEVENVDSLVSFIGSILKRSFSGNIFYFAQFILLIQSLHSVGLLALNL